MINLHALLLVVVVATDPLGPGDHTRKITVDGRERTYLVHIPPKYEPKTPTPVVLVYHGGATNADVMVRFCGLNKKSDEAGFIAVYPNGTGRTETLLTYNAGNCCGYAMINKVDDVEFTRKLLDDLATAANVDPKRIFATGMSNGAIMSYLLASEMSDRIAAIAPVGASMGTETCKPKRPVPVIHFHGSDDKYAPFHGGMGEGIAEFNSFSVDHSIKAWVKANGCAAEPVVTTIPDQARDGTTITCKTYGSGKEGSEIVLFEIHGGGHTWPGQQPRLNFLGKSTKNISANDLMWDFFVKHPMK